MDILSFLVYSFFEFLRIHIWLTQRLAYTKAQYTKSENHVSLDNTPPKKKKKKKKKNWAPCTAGVAR
jgi:hypothetical protein